MNHEIDFEITVEVRWNALENTILSYLYHDERNGYPSEGEYDVQGIRQMNNHIAQTQNPDSGWEIPERFWEEDMHGNVPAQDLFDKTETLTANMERAQILTDTFTYDENAEL